MSSKWHGGKGDAPRSGFDHQAYAENFDRIFNKHDKCGTDECCMTCDTAVTNTFQPVDSKQEKNIKKD